MQYPPKMMSLVCLLLLLLNNYVEGQSVFTGYDEYGWVYYFDQDDTAIQCEDYIDCRINCYGSQSCDFASIIGPKYADLYIVCNSNYDKTDYVNTACNSMNIYAEQSNNLYIDVYTNKNYQYQSIYQTYKEFFESTTYTPQNGETVIKCGMDEDDGSNNTILYCGREHTFYSNNGFESVQWIYSNQSSWQYLNDHPDCISTMYCGNNWEHHCSGWIIDGHQNRKYYKCKNTSSECDYFHRYNQHHTPIPSMQILNTTIITVSTSIQQTVEIESKSTSIKQTEIESKSTSIKQTEIESKSISPEPLILSQSIIIIITMSIILILLLATVTMLLFLYKREKTKNEKSQRLQIISMTHTEAPQIEGKASLIDVGQTTFPPTN
eukprot:96621_1